MKNKLFYSLIILVISTVIFSGCFFASSIKQDTLNKNKVNPYIKPSSFIDASKSRTQEELLEKVSPSIVGIMAITGKNQSIGTGVSINDKSFILTNNHVVDNAKVIYLYLSNGKSCSASLVWRDSSYDLAILQASESIPYLKMVKEGEYKTGQEVIAVGTPLDLAFKNSATKGIISAVNRTLIVQNDNGESSLDNLIQHDASINPGNSGGPLLNMKGEVIGINTVKIIDAEGMGFAIPVDTIHPLVKNINANGYYNTAYMGLFGYDANLNKIGNGKIGYYVQNVAVNSPANSIGLKKGDVILKINGKEIKNTMSLRREIYSHQVGEKLYIEYEREGKIYNTIITLTEHPCCYKSQKIPMFN